MCVKSLCCSQWEELQCRQISIAGDNASLAVSLCSLASVGGLLAMFTVVCCRLTLSFRGSPLVCHLNPSFPPAGLLRSLLLSPKAIQELPFPVWASFFPFGTITLFLFSFLFFSLPLSHPGLSSQRQTKLYLLNAQSVMQICWTFILCLFVCSLPPEVCLASDVSYYQSN